KLKLKQKVIEMSTAVKEMDRVELFNLERLAYILKGLSVAELETLEFLLDEEAFRSINQSLKELEKGEGIPIDEW
ncbi:MAG: hypothetical protein KAV25_10150, partial [Methanophagales archaeon]|nr:hypothetical protein [Methanophagales archaeon]